ncbi:MAG: hypothetical protein JRI70_10515, partial [Deltaproteobacteria bacterium]|nr:hypothetical protein [Deltaproteobacteria bacterium]
ELISTPGTTDKVPALGFTYLTPGADPEATVEESVGARFAWNGNELSQNGVCRGCHGTSISWYRYPYLAPHLSDPLADPETVSISGTSGNVVITCRLDDFNGSGGYIVMIDLTALNGNPAQLMYDDGDLAHCDAVAGDGTYSICVEIPAEAGSGSRTLVITAEDVDGMWSTPLNWSTDAVPVAGQSVAFNTTSDTDCTVDTMVDNLASISLNYGYNSTVTLNANCVGGSNELTLTGALTVNSGTLLCKADTTVINEASGGDVVTPHGQGMVINAANVAVGEDGHISADFQGFLTTEGPGGAIHGGGGYGGRGGSGNGGVIGLTYGSLSQPTALGSGGRYYSVGGSGGGALKLVVAGTVTVDGTISVNGEDSTQCCDNGGGSGGSLWVITSTLAGSGFIAADGGQGAAKGGAGGGGRIALEWNTRTFDGVISAKGAVHPWGEDFSGAHGTIWVPEDKWDELWNATYHVNGSIALAPNSHPDVPETYVFGELHIDSGATLECQGDLADVNEASGGEEGNPHGSGVIIEATSIVIEEDAALSANELGFIYNNQGPGTTAWGGAGHGSRGGPGNNGVIGLPYGLLAEPTALGSSGRHYSRGGSGGGAVKLIVDNLMVNGTLSANGQNATGCCDNGGGSGGSLWVIVDTLAGSGSITADGGTGAAKGGSAAGGRIAFDWTTRTFDGVISARGATHSWGEEYYGNNGTIWVPSDKW